MVRRTYDVWPEEEDILLLKLFIIFENRRLNNTIPNASGIAIAIHRDFGVVVRCRFCLATVGLSFPDGWSRHDVGRLPSIIRNWRAFPGMAKL